MGTDGTPSELCGRCRRGWAVCRCAPVRSARADIVDSAHGPDDFVRTGIVIAAGRITSLDILREDGSLLARVNIGAWAGGGGSVDTIIGQGQRGTFKAWQNGIPTVNAQTPEGTTVHTVVIG